MEINDIDVHKMVRDVLNQMNALTIQSYVFLLGEELAGQVAGDVVLIACKLDQHENYDNVAFNIVINWKFEVSKIHSSSTYLRHTFN